MSVNVNKGEHWFRTLRVTVIIKDACCLLKLLLQSLKKVQTISSNSNHQHDHGSWFSAWYLWKKKAAFYRSNET